MDLSQNKDIKYFINHYFHLIFSNVLIKRICSLLTLLLIVRVLDKDNYGVFVLFLSVSGIATILTTWVQPALVRFGREEFILDKTLAKTFWSISIILSPCFALLFLFLFLFQNQLTAFIGISYAFYYIIFFFVLASSLSANIPRLFQAIGWMRFFAYIPQVINIAWLTIISVLYFSNISVSVEILIGLYMISHFFMVIISFFLLKTFFLPLTLSKQWIKKCFHFSYPLILSNMGATIIGHVDQIMIGIYLPPSFVGAYNVAYKGQDYVFGLPNLSRGLLLPIISSLVVKGKADKITIYVNKYVPQIVFFWSLVICLFISFSREIFLLFGKDYVASFLPFSILLIAGNLRIFYVIESPILVSYGFTKEIAFMAIGTAFVNLTLDFLLIPVIGIAGAALASAISILFIVTIRSWIVRIKTKLNNFPNYFWSFPAFLCIPAIPVDYLPFRILLLCGVLLISYIVARRSHVFDRDSLSLLDRVDIPPYFRRIAKKAYSGLLIGK